MSEALCSLPGVPKELANPVSSSLCSGEAMSDKGKHIFLPVDSGSTKSKRASPYRLRNVNTIGCPASLALCRPGWVNAIMSSDIRVFAIASASVLAIVLQRL